MARMALMPEVSDEVLTETLCRFAGATAVVLRDPERWLGWGEPAEGARLPQRVVSKVGHAALGDVPPGSKGWAALPAKERADWWVRRISNVAGFLAGTPRVAGLVADRVPLQAGLGAAASGLAVCAVAREHGVRDPDDWVPLLARVLFDRKLAPTSVTVEEPDGGPDAVRDEAVTAAPGPLRRSVGTVWRLARTMIAVNGMFDDRPRGLLPFRALGKVPVVGLVGGWLDERGAVKRAAKKTAKLVAKR
jgi:hypothetical protein